MDYLASTFQGYQPIVVGAGCLALGYMYGRHCRSVVEAHVDVPTASDAACCARTECNYVSDHAAVEPDTMAVIQRPASCCPSDDSALNYSDRGIVEKPERCGKRNSGQLEIFQMLRKKDDDALWAQTSAFKKQKGVPVITIHRKEPTPSKATESEQDSDDEILARRLEYFINRSASINKPGGSHHVLKLSNNKKQMKKKKKKFSADMVTKGTTTMDSSHKTDVSEATTTRRSSGLRDLAAPGECSLDDTCRSPKTTVGVEDDYRAVDETGCSAPQTEPVPCVKEAEFFSVKYSLSHPLEGYLGGDDSLGPDFVGLMDTSQCELQVHEPEAGNDSDHSMGENEEDGRPGDASEGGDTVLVESPEPKRLASPPPELNHVQDRCFGEVERGGRKSQEHQVPMDKVLKVEIYELLHAADCAKVSFEEIVSLLEEKLKVVLREDKAHIVSLVREVISISKLLEEDKALEGSETLPTTQAPAEAHIPEQ